MKITDLIQLESIKADLEVTSKKSLLQELSTVAFNNYKIDESTVFDALLERERLGATGIGNGVAIPHGKISGIGKPYGVFAKLKKAVDFDSTDDKPVDLVFLLLAPETAGADHLKALACVSKILRNSDAVKKLRSSVSEEEILRILTEADGNN
ncbi:MAG: Nitrogen regulatory protein [Alphaproteobacteria bacterium ADurb.Bin438]|nr:MAG: Nitrogen regulatory protein [Alphaproteobacteria bacterium ADurb.Bin438]